MDTAAFLRFVVTSNQAGWLNISSSEKNGRNWRQYWKVWPNDEHAIVKLVEGLADEGLNVYYSPHLFTEQSAEKQYVMQSRTAYCDLDKADTVRLPLKPSMLVRTSDENYQGYWILNEWLELDELEAINERIAITTPLADNCWALGHMLRIPNTVNYKYDPPQKVRVHSSNKSLYIPSDFNAFPTIESARAEKLTTNDFTIDAEWIKAALQIPAGVRDVHDLWDKIKPNLAPGTEVHMYNEAPDRSASLWRLMCELFRAKCTLEQVYCIAHASANNKFRDLRYKGDYELAKDVLRAQYEIHQGPTGIRGRVNDARRAGGPVAERKQGIAAMCRNQMSNHGTFIHARGGTLWYILNQDGKPVPISKASMALNVLLDNMFALNSTEPEHGYVVSNLISQVSSMPERGEIATLSHYMPDSNTMLLHTGQRDVLRITPDSIDIVTNGYRDIVFLWSGSPHINLDLDARLPNDDSWHNVLFGDSLNNLASDTFTPEQASALLRAWFVALLMRNALASQPILALFGQPGSGKSTLFKRFYALIYGPQKAISGVGTPNEFDHAMAVSPLLALDNVDTFERWLPDRIARAAAKSEITKRQLYTDLDTITMQSQAFLGITAHNPKFGREDVMDRLIMLTFERLTHFLDETPMIRRIADLRAELWAAIARDIQKVLAQPVPSADEVAQFRVQDFSNVGQRVANALGFGDTFRNAIMHMVQQQKGFVLEEDALLVEVIDKYIRSPRYKNDEFHAPPRYWSIFDLLITKPDDRINFSKRYGNSVKLGRKFLAMQDALRQRYTVESKTDDKGVRVWRFDVKETGNNGTQTS